MHAFIYAFACMHILSHTSICTYTRLYIIVIRSSSIAIAIDAAIAAVVLSNCRSNIKATTSNGQNSTNNEDVGHDNDKYKFFLQLE